MKKYINLIFGVKRHHLLFLCRRVWIIDFKNLDSQSTADFIICHYDFQVHYCKLLPYHHPKCHIKSDYFNIQSIYGKRNINQYCFLLNILRMNTCVKGGRGYAD